MRWKENHKFTASIKSPNGNGHLTCYPIRCNLRVSLQCYLLTDWTKANGVVDLLWVAYGTGVRPSRLWCGAAAWRWQDVGATGEERPAYGTCPRSSGWPRWWWSSLRWWLKSSPQVNHAYCDGTNYWNLCFCLCIDSCRTHNHYRRYI